MFLVQTNRFWDVISAAACRALAFEFEEWENGIYELSMTFPLPNVIAVRAHMHGCKCTGASLSRVVVAIVLIPENDMNFRTQTKFPRYRFSHGRQVDAVQLLCELHAIVVGSDLGLFL